ncbi:uncharacterized protein RSE6_06928 [Rhynchosporium secalis]|uniref:Uncharacterized protein n=1 Tax=Rhynchosporium secalis TaxID=38038 RepID=A0A1E1MCL9_RHYSE|nr:uncharacterized protein RSE6_06928 [Rhynchosporium secalis]
MEQSNGFLADYDEQLTPPSSPRQDSPKLDGDDAFASPTTDYESFEEQYDRRSTQRWQYRAIGAGLAILFLIFGTGSIISTTYFSAYPASTSMGACGRTPEQARQNGCIFDLMMSGWTHPPCYDQELSDQFLRENNFAFFRDREGTQQVTEAEARLGNYKFIYTNGTFHYQHCTYIWAKQVQARRRSVYVLDSQSRSVEHVEHCFRRVGNPNITQIQLQTGTKLHSSTWRLDCIIGEREVHTEH